MDNTNKLNMHLWVLFFFFLVSIVFLWPLPIFFGSKVVGPTIGDNYEYLWKLWWVEHSVFEKGISPWFIKDIFFPYGFELASGAFTPMHTFGGAGLTNFFGPIITYNFFTLLSFVLGGFFTYLYVFRQTKSFQGGILAGVIYSFSPYHYIRVGGQFNVIAVQWIPLFFLLLDTYLTKHKTKDAMWAGLIYAINTLSSWYYGAILMLLTPFYVLISIAQDWNRDAIKQYLKGFFVFTLISFVLIFPFLYPNLTLQQQDQAKVPLEMVSFWSASIADYFTPSMDHFLWGDWVVEKILPHQIKILEFNLSWGIIASLLAFYGWSHSENKLRKRWGGMIVIALLFSLGPSLKIFTHLVSISAESGIGMWLQESLDWLATFSFSDENYSLVENGQVVIPLPGLLIRWFIPGFSSIRSWGRFSILALLGVSIFAGVGLDRFLNVELSVKASGRAGIRKAWGVAILFIALVLFEFYPGPAPLVDVAPRTVDYWLAEQPEKVTVIQMPIEYALSGAQMYYWSYHQQRLASGYSTYMPIIFKEKFPDLETFPSDASLDVLRNWGLDAEGDVIGVDYILVDEQAINDDIFLLEEIDNQPDLELLITIDAVRVYRINN